MGIQKGQSHVKYFKHCLVLFFEHSQILRNPFGALNTLAPCSLPGTFCVVSHSHFVLFCTRKIKIEKKVKIAGWRHAFSKQNPYLEIRWTGCAIGALWLIAPNVCGSNKKAFQSWFRSSNTHHQTVEKLTTPTFIFEIRLLRQLTLEWFCVIRKPIHWRPTPPVAACLLVNVKKTGDRPSVRLSPGDGGNINEIARWFRCLTKKFLSPKALPTFMARERPKHQPESYLSI